MPSFFGNLGRSLQEKGVYNTWMFQEQDLIQSFAKTYADRIIAEAFEDVVGGREVKGTSLEAVMNKVFQLHLLSTLERDLAWFMENDVLTVAQGEEVGYISVKHTKCVIILHRWPKIVCARLRDLAPLRALAVSRGSEFTQPATHISGHIHALNTL